MAARLFAEIAQRFSVKMPLTAILKSPTVRVLAQHLDRERSSPTGSLIDLKPGGTRSLFFVHDGKGETLLYLNLARRMPDDLSVIGIEPHRVPGIPLAHARIEDMATFYVEEVRKKQPQGPYFFAGMCAGGVIAYEMASQLLRAGEKVELVALLDAPTPQAPKKIGRITQHRLGRLRQALGSSETSRLTPTERAKAVASAITGKLMNALVWETRQRAKNLSIRARFTLLRQILARGASWPSFVPELSAHQILNSAQARYVPKPLTIGAIVLARAKSGEANDTPYSSIYVDPTLGWESVTENLTVIDVEGGHSSMLQETFVDSLASALMPYVKQKPASNT
jgi:thioesterase domain-containing protein